MKRSKLLILIFSCLFVGQSIAQRNIKDSIIGSPWLTVSYGGNWTAGDLAERYGYLNHIGLTTGYKTNKNYFWALDGNFIFGNKLRMGDILANLRDSKGNITDQNGDIGTVVLYARGFNANIAFGKIFPVLSPNKNCGIFVHGGVGFLAHKVRVETQDHFIPSLELDYRKGYDRLTVGPNFHQFAGYAYMANRGFLNFYAGFYAQQGLTKNVRTIFFDMPEVPVSIDTRLDMQFGFKVGWFIPIYKRLPKDFYYN
jgi:hypothetical protein